MKKILISFLIGFILMASLIAAPPMPNPVKIDVTINGHRIEYEKTEVTNLGSGEILTLTEVNSLRITQGVGIFDLSEFKQGVEGKSRHYVGDEIKIVACNVHPSCTQTFRIDVPLADFLPKTVEINIQDEAILETQYIWRIQCWDGTWRENKEECPVKPTPEVITEIKTETKYICEDGVEVAKAEDCPIKEPETKNYILETFIAIIALVLGALGYKYKWLKGFTKMWLGKAKKADTPEKKKKVIESGTKAIKTVLTKDKEGKYKK